MKKIKKKILKTLLKLLGKLLIAALGFFVVTFTIYFFNLKISRKFTSNMVYGLFCDIRYI